LAAGEKNKHHNRKREEGDDECVEIGNYYLVLKEQYMEKVFPQLTP
jgi:hypothetical protein